mmetsp:Transcript_166158/g.533334  ORF Transcript_166158/g.533334 Transcript_166158/m.533334 type:complete len:340 (-) Transcript_166158:217-1236(-)
MGVLSAVDAQRNNQRAERLQAPCIQNPGYKAPCCIDQSTIQTQRSTSPQTSTTRGCFPRRHCSTSCIHQLGCMPPCGVEHGPLHPAREQPCAQASAEQTADPVFLHELPRKLKVTGGLPLGLLKGRHHPQGVCAQIGDGVGEEADRRSADVFAVRPPCLRQVHAEPPVGDAPRPIREHRGGHGTSGACPEAEGISPQLRQKHGRALRPLDLLRGAPACQWHQRHAATRGPSGGQGRDRDVREAQNLASLGGLVHGHDAAESEEGQMDEARSKALVEPADAPLRVERATHLCEAAAVPVLVGQDGVHPSEHRRGQDLRRRCCHPISHSNRRWRGRGNRRR